MNQSRPSHLARQGPLPRWLAPITVPLSWAYGAAVAVRNARLNRGHGVQRVDLPVISIGNIVVGGSGKSPVVGWIAAMLRDMGHQPMIALRGYAARPGEQSDEALEHQARDPRVPVVVGANRRAAITDALASGIDADCVLLDDGFQHRRLARDLDLVLIDARRPCLDGRLLPAGRLREPASALRRADAVVVTHATRRDPTLGSAIRRLHGRAPLAWTDHRWSGLSLHVGDGSSEEVQVEWLAGRTVVVMAGLADPSSVVAMATAAGATVHTLHARDHQRYDASWIRRLADRVASTRADAALLTGKDWAKVAPLLDSSRPDVIVVPRLVIEPIDGESAIRAALRRTLSSEGSSESDTVQ